MSAGSTDLFVPNDPVLGQEIYIDSAETGRFQKTGKEIFAHRGDLTHDRTLVNDFLRTEYS